MAKKPTYEELEQRITELENGSLGRKKAEEQSNFDHSRLMGILDSIPDGVYIVDQHFNIEYINPVIERGFGKIHGRKCYQYFHDRTESCPWCKNEEVFAGRSVNWEWYSVKNDRHYELFDTPFQNPDGSISKLEIFHDITDRKRSEEALKRSAERFRRLFEQASDAFFIHDFNNGKILEANECACRNLGYTRDELLELNVSDIEISHTPETIVEICTRAEKGSPVIVEGVHRRKDGSTFPVEISLGMLQDEDPTLLLAIVRDTTERKQTQEALRESEDKFRSFAEQSLVGIYLISGDAFKYVNPKFAEIFGYSVDECLNNMHFPQLVHPEDLATVKKQVSKRLSEETKAVRYSFRGIKKSGETIHVEIFGSSMVLKGKTVATGTMLDITERKQAEEALQESEEKYRSMMEAMIEPIYICSPDFRVEYMNPAMIRRTGRDAIGEHCFKALHGLDEKCPWCMHHKAQQGEYLELEIVSPKDNRSYHISQSPVAHGDGSVSNMTIFRDITEMRETEAQLYRAQKMEAMGLLAGGVAHDLNNILSGIVSYPELLLMDLPEDSPLWKPIKTIQESGMRAADVVEDLLTIARGVTTGKGALNLNTIATEYLESPECQKLDKTHSFVNFETELDPDLLNMSGSPIHIKKTLMNLVINASEAIEGKGTVTVSTMNRYLDEPLKGYTSIRTGEYAVLSVSDDGFGITPEDLEKIFEPFYTKKVMGRSGTGLGLAVVWNTVQDHNGYINVESSEKGTVFELYFPVTRKDVFDVKEKTPLENYLGYGEKILVVDDEERQRVIACGILTKLGYMAEAVSSGEEAIEYVKVHAVDLIVLDMVMPKGINGHETYQQIIKIRPGQKAVIASGYAKTKEVGIAQELGAGKYIKKPYTLEKIGVAVKKELEK